MARTAVVRLVLAFGLGFVLTAPADAQDNRVSGSEKGSVLIYSKVEIRWDAAGDLIQDTFVDLTNDYPGVLSDPAGGVLVQMYFINGDPPLPASGAERAHLGWNWEAPTIPLDSNDPQYWSAATGAPAGVSDWTILDPGTPPGRPDPEGSTDRVLRGYIIAYAVDAAGEEILWNHLKGDALIINYANGEAWEYNAYAFQAIPGAGGAPPQHGDATGTPGELHLDGDEYDDCFMYLLLDFVAAGATAYSPPLAAGSIVADTDLTLFPVNLDVRQDGDGPVTTKAKFDLWNGNEVKLSGTIRCITCWDQTLISRYDAPNHFLRANLQTDNGKARIDGMASTNCPGSVASPLLGVAAKMLACQSAAKTAMAGTNLVGMGTEDGLILADVIPSR